MPPSKIADTWSPDELQDAVILADLEGWGKMERFVGRICAAIHNAQIIATVTSGKAEGKIKFQTELDHMPKRKWVRPKAVEDPNKRPEEPSKIKSMVKKQLASLGGLAGF